MKRRAIKLDGNSLTFSDALAIAEGASIALSASAKKQVEASRKLVAKLAKGKAPIYGVNTGFGYFANRKIDTADLEKLQYNLLRSHAAGYGSPLSVAETRLAMALRLNILLKGYTGVRYEVCEALFNLIEAEVYPIIPSYGSVGASGDLIPLAHLALPLIGEGYVHFKGEMLPALKALRKVGLKPIKLEEKEGLGLINGTQMMLSIGCLALHDAFKLSKLANLITALTYEAMIASLDALDPKIHRLRGQSGQIETAREILQALKGSYLHTPTVKHLRIQDPYSLRCAPQIHGPSLDALNYTQRVIENELNAATDNPLVFAEEGKMLSGGNFHGQALALVFDFASMAIAELGNVSDRRLEVMVNPHLSGLSAFLAAREGINSGYMAMQYLSASLVNENKILANPACTDSIPGNVGIEDHVSMGMTSARKMRNIVNNVYTILSIEALAAAQAIDLRNIHKLGKGTAKLYQALRRKVPTLTDDRIVAEDISKAVDIVKSFAWSPS